MRSVVLRHIPVMFSRTKYSHAVLPLHAHGRLLAEKLGKAAEHGAPTSSTRHQEGSGLQNDSARYASAVMEPTGRAEPTKVLRDSQAVLEIGPAKEFHAIFF